MKTEENINNKYLPALSRIFSSVVMESLARKGHSSYLTEVCINSGLIEAISPATTLREFFDQVYNLLLKDISKPRTDRFVFEEIAGFDVSAGFAYGGSSIWIHEADPSNGVVLVPPYKTFYGVLKIGAGIPSVSVILANSIKEFR